MGTVVQFLDIKWSVELSRPTASKLVQMVYELHNFEKVQKEKLHTPAQRLKMLEELEAHAKAIEIAIEKIDMADFLWLDTMLACDTPSPEINLKAVGFEDQIGGHVIYAQRMACNLADAVQKAAKRISDNGGKGRKPVLSSYAGFIAGVAFLVKNEGIKPGRGGDFESICNDVFLAAAIPAKPEGAIRYFLEHMAEGAREQGHCL